MRNMRLSFHHRDFASLVQQMSSMDVAALVVIVLGLMLYGYAREAWDYSKKAVTRRVGSFKKVR
jgi:hypothetical protein